MSNTTNPLPLGCDVAQDQDGDWIIIPPADVTIFSVPGEGVLLGQMTRGEAVEAAMLYLADLA